MGWYAYHDLLQKYGGDLTKATEEELEAAAAANPLDPVAALELAKDRYRRKPQ